MLVSTISNVLCAWFAFFLPCFSTFKALSHRPVSEKDLERWSMYWTVLGVFLAFQYLAEWLIYWFPFYWEIKTIFLLFLALPQTEGSTFIYRTYLEPFLTQNEAQLDATIVKVQSNAFSFLQAQISRAWSMILDLSKKIPAPSAPVAGETPATNTAGSTQLAAAPWQAAMNLWNQYGQSIISALPIIPKAQPAPHAVPTNGSSTSVQSSVSDSSTQYRAPFTAPAPGVPFPEAQHF